MHKTMLRPSPLYSLALFAVALVLVGQGCTLGKKPATVDGGIFKSVNKGEAWVQKVTVPIAAGVGKINDIDVLALAIDPQDRAAVYIGTFASGLFFSLDGGETWMQTRDTSMRLGRVNDISVDPKNKCVIFAAQNNRIARSDDCARTWKTVFTDEREGSKMNAVRVSYKDSHLVYAGGSMGEVLRSTNGGDSWSVVHRKKMNVWNIFVNVTDGNRVYATSRDHGIWRSDDAGETWYEVSPDAKQYSGALDFTAGVIHEKNPEHLIIGTKYGLLQTKDGGSTWEPIPLITAPGEASIFAVTLNTQNPAEIYYGTISTFYRSMNGGESWETKRLPTTRAITALNVDPQDGTVLYMGVTKPNR